jgi:hypothetical protein
MSMHRLLYVYLDKEGVQQRRERKRAKAKEEVQKR